MAALPRRSFLATAASLLAGCAAAPPPPPQVKVAPVPPPVRVGELTHLLPLAQLRWVLLVKPREIASIPWLIPAIARIAPEESLARFAGSLGFDLRQIPEAAVATYAGEGGESTLYLVRHNGDPIGIERLFRKR